MRKFILGIFVCLSVGSCRTARYANHYKANLEQYSKLVGPVKDPQRYGDSLEDRINQTIDVTRQSVSKSTHTDIEGMGVGVIGAGVSKVLPVGSQNQNLIFGISVTGIAIGIIDLFISTYEPGYYKKNALEVLSAWDHSSKDNTALTSLRASLFALQETWPAYAP